jgi:hypothetical protein
VYLTDLDESFATKFKDWMRLRELPRAPIMFWELFERSLGTPGGILRIVGYALECSDGRAPVGDEEMRRAIDAIGL